MHSTSTMTAPDLTGVCRSAECEEPHCRSCKRRHLPDDAGYGCTVCLHQARTALVEIHERTARLREHAYDGSDRHGRPLAASAASPGGEPLMLTLPHADVTDRERMATAVTRGWATGTAAYYRTEWETMGPAEVEAVIGRDIAAARGLVGRVIVAEHLTWAAREWDCWAVVHSMLTGMADRLAAALGETEQTISSAVPCPGCGGRTLTILDTAVGSEWYECRRSACSWDGSPDEIGREARWAIGDEDGWVPVADAAAVLGRHEQTLRAWVARGECDRGLTAAGHVAVRWRQVQDLDAARPRRGASAFTSTGVPLSIVPDPAPVEPVAKPVGRGRTRRHLRPAPPVALALITGDGDDFEPLRRGVCPACRCELPASGRCDCRD